LASRSHAPQDVALALAMMWTHVAAVGAAPVAPVDVVAAVDAYGVEAGTPMPAALREELVSAAVEFSERPRPRTPIPATLALPAAAFAREVCRDANIPCDNVMAAYDPAHLRVLYRAELDLTKVWERSFVVHELVHWLQHQAQADTQADPDCKTYRAAEREAYTVQNRYLRHHQSGRRAGTMLNMLHC
jgi:hypothetical protein